MTSPALPRARRRALAGGLAALGLSVGMIMTNGVAPASAATWPTANGSQAVTATIKLSGTKDYGMKRLYGSGDLGTGGQSENQDPILDLAAGTVLKNVIIGAPAADGIHCEGSCTLQNVWWEDVGEDAATFKGSSSSNVYTVSGGGAKEASDKVFQFNGAGTLNVTGFAVQNFGKLVRSCGNCKTQYKRTINLSNIEATYKGLALVGINTNYGDSATLKKITIVGDSSKKIVPCQK
ncbi:MAG: pectate lyase, partial [Streptomyces sp.]|nr:pectate lyase [Streptomyces sp.]